MNLWSKTAAVLRCFATRDHPGGQPWIIHHMKINQRTPTVHIFRNSLTPLSPHTHTPPPGASRRNAASQISQMARGVIASQHPSNAEGEKIGQGRLDRIAYKADAVTMSRADRLKETQAQHQAEISSMLGGFQPVNLLVIAADS